MKRSFLISLFVLTMSFCYGYNLVTINGLQYAFQSNSASVVSGYDYNDSYVSSNYYMHYSNSTYIIPDKVTYDGNVFVVDRIGFRCFDDGNVSHPYSNRIKKIVLPESIKQIGYKAFAGTNISSMIIPKSVLSFVNGGAFGENDFLATIFYTSETPPTNWTATTITYVPDKVAYSSPKYFINGASTASIVEMISFSNDEFIYTGQAPTTTWTNNVQGYVASFSMPTLKSEVGHYEEIIPVTFTNEDESFSANVVYRYTINPAKIIAKVSDISREYGEDNPQFNISYSGFLSGETESVITTPPSVNTIATKTSNVGEYPITISGGVANNYEFEYIFGVLTVTKAPLSARVNDTIKVYGTQNPIFSIEYYGLKNNEKSPVWLMSPEFQTEANQSSHVGQYVVDAINGLPMNYELGEITAGTLTILPAQLTIKANNATRLYFSEEPTFSYTCIGFVNGDNDSVLSPSPTLYTSAFLSSSVGIYEINVSEVSSPNYVINYINGTLTITPRPLTASVDDYERKYNEENPQFKVKYEGFVGNENECVLEHEAIASTSATISSNVGTYIINVSGGQALNYSFSYQNGILTIGKAEQTIVWDQNLLNLSVGDQIELNAKASSGLPITYIIDGSNIAEVYQSGEKVYLDCFSSGQTQLIAQQSGNQNYYSSQRSRKTVVIADSYIPVTGISLDQTSVELNLIGGTFTINATVIPENASNKMVIWSSSNDDVCQVSEGIIQANGEGSCTISARTIDGNYIATCNVIVDLNPNSIVGDVNSDGEVNIADINVIINAILGGFFEEVYDVNEDGEVNIADINAIINLILSN